MHWRSASLVILLAAAMCPARASAQEWAQKMFDHQEYDFGSVARGAEAQHRFPIKNLYKEDVHVSAVYSSCGCTSPRVTQDLIQSGETAYIVADFNTRSFTGPHTATVTVLFDGQFPAEVRLNVKGNIRKDVVFIPGKIDLGTIDVGAPVERKVNVSYAGRSDWQIVDVRSANNHFEVELTPKDRSVGRVDYELLFRLKPTAPAGYLNDRLTIVTNDVANRLIPLAVEGNLVAAMTVSPSSLQMGVVKADNRVTKQLIVKGKSDFHVLRVECDDPAFKCQVSPQAKKLHLIPVTFTASSTPGKVVAKLRVITDATGVSLPEVTAHAIVEGAPVQKQPAAAAEAESGTGSEKKPATIEKPPAGTDESAKPATETKPRPELPGDAEEKPASGVRDSAPPQLNNRLRIWRVS